jgi:hypothetical protein
VAEEDYDQQVEVIYDQFCCEEARQEIGRQIPKTRAETQLIVSCPSHGIQYGVIRHLDGTYNARRPPS